MMPSIRRFLLINLLLSITITSSLTIIGNYFLDNADIQKHLDVHLKQTAHFLEFIIIKTHQTASSLNIIQHEMIKNNNKTDSNLLPSLENLQFQIWDKNGNLLLHSKNAIPTPLAEELGQSGFNILSINKHRWRVFSKYNANTQLTISVAERYGFRHELQLNLTWDYIFIMLWIFPILGLLIWIIVGYGFNSVKKLANELSNRAINDLSPVEEKNIPLEIQPLVDELNDLFLRLQYEFERSKRFAADAAHELKTPLAALKTQTEVAIRAKTDTERKNASQQILLGVDRCNHLIQQLLTLSRLSQKDRLEDFSTLDLSKTTTEIIAQLAPNALEKNIEIELIKPKQSIKILGNEIMIGILVRNLVDNAIRYTPNNGHVSISISTNNKIHLKVKDTGPGIPKHLRTRVFERFYRTLGTKESGSGLGLAIVSQIVELHNAKINLSAPSKSKTGLEVDVSFDNPSINNSK